jgi:hypothetical protein
MRFQIYAPYFNEWLLLHETNDFTDAQSWVTVGSTSRVFDTAFGRWLA